MAPVACTISATSSISRSKRPKVLGLVSINAATLGDSFDSRSERLMRPSRPDRTSTTWNPLKAALAGLVPCAAAERIELLADRVVERGEPAVVPHDLRLAEPRQVGRLDTQVLLGQHIGRWGRRQTWRRQPRRLGAGPAQLEAEWLAQDVST